MTGPHSCNFFAPGFHTYTLMLAVNTSYYLTFHDEVEAPIPLIGSFEATKMLPSERIIIHLPLWPETTALGREDATPPLWLTSNRGGLNNKMRQPPSSGWGGVSFSKGGFHVKHP